MAKELSPELTAHLMTVLDWIGQAGTLAAPFHVMLHTGSPIEFKDASAQFAGTMAPPRGAPGLDRLSVADYFEPERRAGFYVGSDEDMGPDPDPTAEKAADCSARSTKSTRPKKETQLSD